MLRPRPFAAHRQIRHRLRAHRVHRLALLHRRQDAVLLTHGRARTRESARIRLVLACTSEQHRTAVQPSPAGPGSVARRAWRGIAIATAYRRDAVEAELRQRGVGELVAPLGELLDRVVPAWSDAAKSVSLTGRGARGMASRWDLRCRAPSHECRGQPQAFKRSQRSLWWTAMASPRAHFDHAGVRAREAVVAVGVGARPLEHGDLEQRLRVARNRRRGARLQQRARHGGVAALAAQVERRHRLAVDQDLFGDRCGGEVRCAWWGVARGGPAWHAGRGRKGGQCGVWWCAPGCRRWPWPR